MKTRVFEGAYTSGKQGELGTIRFDAEGNLVSMVMGGMIEIRAEPEELAKKIDYSADLFLAGLVPVDKPIGPASDVASLLVEVSGARVERLQDGPGQRVVRRREGSVLLELGTGAPPVPATKVEIEESLREEVEYPIRDEKVLALARTAAGDAKTDREKVGRLVKFVSDYVEDSAGANAVSVRKVMEKKAGDCTEHTLLLVCLARAAGIPARDAGGLMYAGDELLRFGAHAWVEVVLDGHWVAVDPTWNQPVADGTHIRFGAAGRNEAVLMASTAGMKIRVVKVAKR